MFLTRIFSNHRWYTISAKNGTRKRIVRKADDEAVYIAILNRDSTYSRYQEVREDYTSIAQQCEDCNLFKSYEIDGHHAVEIMKLAQDNLNEGV